MLLRQRIPGRSRNPPTTTIAFSKSSNEGKSWSTPIKVNQTPNGTTAFTPSVDVSSDGTVAVTYYDWRNNTSAAGLPVDYFIVHSRDGGTGWGNSEARITPASFDIEQAPTVGSRGYFIGDYQGLANSGSVVDPFFVQVNNGNAANRTDAFATTVTH